MQPLISSPGIAGIHHHNVMEYMLQAMSQIAFLLLGDASFVSLPSHRFPYDLSVPSTAGIPLSF